MTGSKVSKIIERQIKTHFKIDFTPPKIYTIKDPTTFFNIYEGKEKKHRSHSRLFDLNMDVSYFYDETKNRVILKGFRQNGLKVFKVLESQTMPMVNILHEFIHSLQYQHGKFSKYALTDEGCCEMVSYVISSNIDKFNVYLDYIVVLWNMMEIYNSNPVKKYLILKKYNISNDKDKLTEKFINDFLKKYPSVAKNINHFIAQVEEEEEMTKGFEKYCLAISKEKTIKDMYKLHDYFKAQGEIIKEFK